MNKNALAIPVGWFEIHVADMQRAKVFYASVFKRSLFALETADDNFTMQVFEGDVQSAGATCALVQHRERHLTTDRNAFHQVSR